MDDFNEVRQVYFKLFQDSYWILVLIFQRYDELSSF